MRASRSWIFLLIGVLLAGITGVALYQFATSTRQPTTANGARVDIVVANVTLPPRTVLTADQLGMKEYPSDLVPPGSFTVISDVVGRTSAVQIARSQPIVRDLLSAVGAPEGMSEEIPDGMVMVTFPTNDALTTAGLVSPGDRVDLLVTVAHGTGENAKLTQTTIQSLEVVEVLAPTKDQPQRQRALVFVVDHQVALVLKYLRDAQTTVDLAVRSHTETQSAKTSLVDLQYLLETFGMQR